MNVERSSPKISLPDDGNAIAKGIAAMPIAIGSQTDLFQKASGTRRFGHAVPGAAWGVVFGTVKKIGYPVCFVYWRLTGCVNRVGGAMSYCKT